MSRREVDVVGLGWVILFLATLAAFLLGYIVGGAV